MALQYVINNVIFGEIKETCSLYYNSCKVKFLFFFFKQKLNSCLFQYTFNRPNTYSLINSCSQSCTPGITFDENGFEFVTKCSQPVNQKCRIGRRWSQYFSNEDAIANVGELESCYPGYNYCKVKIFQLKNSLTTVHVL